VAKKETSWNLRSFRLEIRKSLLIIFEFEAAVVSVVGIVLCKSTSISLKMREREKEDKEKGTRWRCDGRRELGLGQPKQKEQEVNGERENVYFFPFFLET